MTNSPRGVAYSSLIYTGLMGGSLIVLSIMSLTAYGCGFDFRQSSVTYMLYLIYYRAGRCYDQVDWNILDGINQDVTVQPIMPTETHAVFRTLIFSVFYLTLNIFLVITCLLALCGLRKTGKSRHFVFWLYFAPFIVFFVALIVMDLLSSGFYIFDYFSTLGVNGLMRILEIQNTEQIRPILEQVTVATRTLPSLIMFAATSKTVVFLIINIVIAFSLPSAVWQVCKENEEVAKTIEEPVGTVLRPSRAHDVDVTVAQVEEESEGRPAYESQPPFNPSYGTSSRKQETHF